MEPWNQAGEVHARRPTLVPTPYEQRGTAIPRHQGPGGWRRLLRAGNFAWCATGSRVVSEGFAPPAVV